MRGGTTTPMVVTTKCSIGENQELWLNRKTSKLLVVVYKKDNLTSLLMVRIFNFQRFCVR